MNRESFDFSLVNKHLKKVGKILLYLFVTMLLGAFIGCGVASGNLQFCPQHADIILHVQLT